MKLTNLYHGSGGLLKDLVSTRRRLKRTADTCHPTKERRVSSCRPRTYKKRKRTKPTKKKLGADWKGHRVKF